jgi:hypothetical protein
LVSAKSHHCPPPEIERRNFLPHDDDRDTFEFHDQHFEGVKMGVSFDFTPDRPEHIDAILNGLDRYNPETTSVFQEYVTQQCEERTVDSYANLALLKL